MKLKYNWDTDMTTAGKDDLILVAIPTFDPEAPIGIEIANWSEDENRWVGEWRYTDSPYANSNPVAWQEVPNIGEDLEGLALEEVT